MLALLNLDRVTFPLSSLCPFLSINRIKGSICLQNSCLFTSNIKLSITIDFTHSLSPRTRENTQFTNQYERETDYGLKKKALFYFKKLEQIRGLILENTSTFIVRSFIFHPLFSAGDLSV
jgi:hypothetical protein